MSDLENVASQIKEATALRAELILEASQAGYSLREIGLACNLSHAGVKKIIKKQELPSAHEVAEQVTPNAE